MPIKTAGIFIINKERKLLVAHPTNHPWNFWSITKGKIDDGETAIDAAMRETREECNIDFRYFLDISLFKLTPVTFVNKKKTLHPFLILEEKNPDIDFSAFVLKCDSRVEPEKGGFPEMDAFKWISIEEAKTVVHESQVKVLEEIEIILINL